jgi:hypothetical protein
LNQKIEIPMATAEEKEAMTLGCLTFLQKKTIQAVCRSRNAAEGCRKVGTLEEVWSQWKKEVVGFQDEIEKEQERVLAEGRALFAGDLIEASMFLTERYRVKDAKRSLDWKLAGQGIEAAKYVVDRILKPTGYQAKDSPSQQLAPIVTINLDCKPKSEIESESVLKPKTQIESAFRDEFESASESAFRDELYPMPRERSAISGVD